MGFSFEQIGLRRICVVWALLGVIHWGLYSRFPELAPVYAGHRQIWVSLFLLLEAICIFTAIAVAFATIASAITARSIKNVDRVGFMLFVILMVVLISLYH
jgi:hypothetical protein